MNKNLQKLGLAVTGLTASTLALANPSEADFSSLTSGIEVGSIIGGILAVAGVMITVHLTFKGIQFIRRAVSGG